MDSHKPRFAAPALLAIAALLFPASSLGATTFGSRLQNDPANSGECEPDNPGDPATPCTLVSFIHPSDPDGDPYAGGAPVSGVITKFRIRAHGGGDGGSGTLAAEVTFRVADINRPDPNDEGNALATAAGTGPTVTIPAEDNPIETPIYEFDGRLPVAQGQHLAIDGTNVHATYNNSGQQFTYRFTPPLVDGQGARGSNEATGELLVQADIEPDADGDGFGDETQDGCPSQAQTQGGCDTSKPGVSGVKVGTRKIAYRLSEAAEMTFKVQRAKKGRRVGGKCRRATAKNRSAPKCTRYKNVRGSLGDDGQAGLNELLWKGRIGGKKLRAGRYRLVITAVDAVGNETTRRVKFRIKKKKKRS
jgi:hypothetical protein